MIVGMKQTEIGFIPNEWDALQFGEIFEIVKSFPFSRNKLISEETSTKVQNIHYGDIHSKFTNNHLDFENENVPYIIGDFLTDWHNQFLKNGDIVIADVSEDLIDIGKCIEVKNITNRKVLGGLHTIVARDRKKIITEGFGAYIFQHPEVRKELRSIATGMSVYGISKGNLNKLHIPIPPLPEQRKIAYVLSTVQKAIEQQDKLIRTTTELKKALMQKLFTEGTKGEKQKLTEIGLVPESWEVVELGRYAFIENGYAFKSEDYIKTGIPLIRISNVSHGFFINNDNKYLPEEYLRIYEKFSLKKGDLIISLTRPVTSGGLKYCFVEEKDLPALLNQRVGRFQIKKEERLSKDFLFHLVFSNYFVGELFKLFGSSSQQPNVSPSQLESFKVPIPLIDEQKEIANFLFLLFNKSRKAEEKKQVLSDLFKTLLHELMTGQRRVNEIEFEASSTEYQIKEQPLRIAAER